MSLSDAEIVAIRRRVGSVPDDTELNSIYDRTGSVTETAREVLELRLAELLRTPATFSVSGEYSQGTAENIKGLQQSLAELGDLDNDDPADDSLSTPVVTSVAASSWNSR